MKFSFPVKIYLIALILRLIPVFLTMNMGIGLDDMFQYDMLARSLASGHGFRWYALEDLERLEPYVSLDLSTASEYDPRYGVVFAGILIVLLALNWGFELHRDADKIAAILQPNGNQLYLPY